MRRNVMLNNKWCVALWVIVLTVSAMGQTVSPPIAEYRGSKAQGSVELRNDSDQPLATVLEIRGFVVDQNGNFSYVDLDTSTTVNVGSTSFIIPPRESHYVFYKASSRQESFWFAILATMTNARRSPQQVRINYVLPHIVYVYQKAKLKRDDVETQILPNEHGGNSRLEIRNKSHKLGRIETIQVHTSDDDKIIGGIPIFPAQTRYVVLSAGHAGDKATLKLNFEDGFTLSSGTR